LLHASGAGPDGLGVRPVGDQGPPLDGIRVVDLASYIAGAYAAMMLADLGAQVVKLKGKDVASKLAEFVREKHITQMIFGHSAEGGCRKYLFFSAVHRFLRDAPPVDVHIVKQQPA